MTQLVFVHGVATRSGSYYDNSVKNRDKLFKEASFQGIDCEIANAMWGDSAQDWAWKMATLPNKADRKKVESFSLSAGMSDEPVVAANGHLSALVKDVPMEAIDTVFASAMQAKVEAGAIDEDSMASFLDAVRFFETAGDDDAQIEPGGSDDEALGNIAKAVATDGAYGFSDFLRRGKERIVNGVGNLLSTGLVDRYRDDLNPKIAQFVGDILVYLKDSPLRTEIRAEVVDKINVAFAAAKAKNEPLILIGHSLGGVILYDLLSSPGQSGLADGFKADMLVTVGSQVGVIEEFKLYDSSSPAYSSELKNKVPMLSTVDHWMNVYDSVDILSFRCNPVFEGVEDFIFSSGVSLAEAHSTYFYHPRFHARLRVRMRARGIIE